MNDRIKLLAEQAGYLPDGFGVGHWDMPECKKFAELIVKECVEVCHKMAEDSDSYVVHDGDTCAEQIKKHFGVEE